MSISPFDPGCVKTCAHEKRAELFQFRRFHATKTHCRSLRSGWSPSTFLKPFLTPAVPPYTSEQGLPYPARRYFVGPLVWCILRDLDDGAPICLVPFVLPKPLVPFMPFRHC